MTTSKHDLTHGRQGGRVVDFEPFRLENCPRCSVCGGRVVSPGRKVHYVCDPKSKIGRGAEAR